VDTHLDHLESRLLLEAEQADGSADGGCVGLAERHLGVAARRHAHELRAVLLQRQLSAS
jgi:hypothetical protein